MAGRDVKSEPGIILGIPDGSMEKSSPGEDDGGKGGPRKGNDKSTFKDI